ncbi:hypothetical protein [Streptomyces chiangmaiensis]|uniref:Uncharacterized protein n=1 Tax=Streptomyces chiangmaiensis TaxID=766497 RepID=A0ABU7FX70_9ACTN|nr:hypothetical protein [Streptomyces chiangmaiensis]MED7828740.1 hypothetical protein [Streptomyces chiangmaiensis]
MKPGVTPKVEPQTIDWEHRWHATSHGMITRRDELIEELGEERAVATIAELQRQLDN